jgi:hypothetical protein
VIVLDIFAQNSTGCAFIAAIKLKTENIRAKEQAYYLSAFVRFAFLNSECAQALACFTQI